MRVSITPINAPVAAGDVSRIVDGTALQIRLAAALIRTTAFIVILNSSQTTTHTVTSVTYYHHNPWYRRVMYEGELVYIQTPAPGGLETDKPPDGAEILDFQETTCYHHEAAFYKKAPGDGYIVVEPPVGAEGSSIPEEAIPDEDADSSLYIFDNAYFTKGVNDSGREMYRVVAVVGAGRRRSGR